MDPGDGLREGGLHTAGAPGELQEFVPGGGNRSADDPLSEGEHHLPAEGGQRRERDAGDGREDPEASGLERFGRAALPGNGDRDPFGGGGSHHDEPVFLADGGAAAAGFGAEELDYGEARGLRHYGRYLQPDGPDQPGGAGADEDPV